MNAQKQIVIIIDNNENSRILALKAENTILKDRAAFLTEQLEKLKKAIVSLTA